MVAAVDGGRARCWSRHGTELMGAVGDVVAELRELLPDGTLVDGELVAVASSATGQVGQDFNRLGQTVFGRHKDPLTSSSSTRCGLPASSWPSGRGTSAVPR